MSSRFRTCFGIRLGAMLGPRYRRWMGDSSSALPLVRALIERLQPEPICDACVTERLPESAREEAKIKIAELSGMAGFERRIGACSMCGATKRVICKTGPVT